MLYGVGGATMRYDEIACQDLYLTFIFCFFAFSVFKEHEVNAQWLE